MAPRTGRRLTAAAAVLALGGGASAADWAEPVTAAQAKLRERGVEIGASVTQFADSLLAGDGNRGINPGGKVDALLALNSGRLGLWPGFRLAAHVEQNYGSDVNNQGDGSLLPINTAMGFPRLGGDDTNLSLVATQAFGEDVSLSVGKFNMLDAIARTPLIGGGGTETFQNTGLAAPISGVTPPYIVGVLLGAKIAPVSLSLLVYDPRNAQDSDVLEEPFADGVTFSLAGTLPIPIAGLPGYHTLRGVYSTKNGLDFRDIPQLVLPSGTPESVDDKGHYLYGAYSFQQFLVQSSDDPTRGWGLFGQAAMSDGNPNPIAGSLLVGVGGNALFLNRPDDRWGVGWFRYFFSSDLEDSLEAVGLGLRDEWGVEIYYDLALIDHVRLGVDLQAVRPGTTDTDIALFASARAKLAF
jgi:porin